MLLLLKKENLRGWEDGSGIKHLLYKHAFLWFPEHPESQTQWHTSVTTSATSALLQRNGGRRLQVGVPVSEQQTFPQTRLEGNTNTWGFLWPPLWHATPSTPHPRWRKGREREGERFFKRGKIMCKWKTVKIISPTTNNFFSEHRFSPLSSFSSLSTAICRRASYPGPATATMGLFRVQVFLLTSINLIRKFNQSSKQRYIIFLRVTWWPYKQMSKHMYWVIKGKANNHLRQRMMLMGIWCW